MSITVVSKKPRPPGIFGVSRWLVAGLCIVLGLAVVLLALRDSERGRRKSESDMLNHANALIWALEAGTRTWLGFEGDRNILQPLVEETAKQPGTIYLMVTDTDGTILAHSDGTQVGKTIPSAELPPFRQLASLDDIDWREVRRGDRDVYEVYRHFKPIRGELETDSNHGHHGQMGRGRRGMGMGMGMMRERERLTANPAETLVMVGLDNAPFRVAWEMELRNIVLTALLVGAVGLVGIMGLLWAHSHRRSQSVVRRLRNEVEQNTRLSALGNLAAGVAHEIRNPLSTIKGLATYLAGKMPKGGPEEEAAKTMVQEVGRLDQVVSGLLEYARPGALPRPAGCDVEAVIERAIRLADADLRAKSIRVERVVRDGAPELCARIDPERFTQALLNIVLNAAQAVPDQGGVVRLAGGVDEAGVFVSVADNGPGMDEEVLGRIFDPYFTTKASGTGLGLAIVRQIIDEADGTVTVKSAAGEGCEVVVHLHEAK